MTRVEFTEFVEGSIEGAIRFAEDYSGQTLSRNAAFRWMGPTRNEPITFDVVQTLVNRVFVDDDLIWPCVNLGVFDVLRDGTVLLEGSVAGFPPQPFGKNWTGSEGPFIFMVGGPFYEKYRHGSSRRKLR